MSEISAKGGTMPPASARTILMAILLAASLSIAAGVRVHNHAAGSQPVASGMLHGCASHGIMITAGANGDGAGGNREVEYWVRNLSGASCLLSGYPRVRLLDKHFVPLPTVLHQGSSYLINDRPHTVRGLPRDSVVFWVSYQDIPSPPYLRCQRVPYLMVLLPGAQLPIVTYSQRGGVPFQPCGPVIAVSSFHRPPRTSLPAVPQSRR